MALNIVWTVLIGLGGVALAWAAARLLARRAWGPRLGGALLALLAVVLLILTGIITRGLILSTAPLDIPVREVSAPTDAESIARGEHIAQTTCSACHNVDAALPLTGGINLSADAGLPLGDIYPPNLTPAGGIAGWSDGELLRAIREGVHPSGRPLLAMPVQRLRHLSDDDALALIAYLRAQPAVENEVPPVRGSLLAAALVGLGIIDTRYDAVEGPVVAPPRAPDAAYGAYLVSYKDCRDCHGEALDGEVAPPAPQGPPLLHIRGWTAEQFVATLRTGVNPDGHELQPPMPWKTYGSMDDVELTAVYEYLKTVQ